MADYNNITLCKLGSEEGEEGDVYANITSTFCRLSSRDDGLYAALSLPFEGYLLERMACMQPHHPSLLNFERVVCMQPYSYSNRLGTTTYLETSLLYTTRASILICLSERHTTTVSQRKVCIITCAEDYSQ